MSWNPFNAIKSFFSSWNVTTHKAGAEKPRFGKGMGHVFTWRPWRSKSSEPQILNPQITTLITPSQKPVPPLRVSSPSQNISPVITSPSTSPRLERTTQPYDKLPDGPNLGCYPEFKERVEDYEKNGGRGPNSRYSSNLNELDISKYMTIFLDRFPPKSFVYKNIFSNKYGAQPTALEHEIKNFIQNGQDLPPLLAITYQEGGHFVTVIVEKQDDGKISIELYDPILTREGYKNSRTVGILENLKGSNEHITISTPLEKRVQYDGTSCGRYSPYFILMRIATGKPITGDVYDARPKDDFETFKKDMHQTLALQEAMANEYSKMYQGYHEHWKERHDFFTGDKDSWRSEGQPNESEIQIRGVIVPIRDGSEMSKRPIATEYQKLAARDRVRWNLGEATPLKTLDVPAGSTLYNYKPVTDNFSPEERDFRKNVTTYYKYEDYTTYANTPQYGKELPADSKIAALELCLTQIGKNIPESKKLLPKAKPQRAKLIQNQYTGMIAKFKDELNKEWVPKERKLALLEKIKVLEEANQDLLNIELKTENPQ